MDSGRSTISVRDFLNILFPSKADGFITLTEFKRSWPDDYDPADDPEGKTKPEIHPFDMRLEDYRDPVGDRELYYCISRCAGLTPRARLPSRKRAVSTHVIVCDDIGTKIALEKFTKLGIVPTYALETSKGNFQLGFRLKDPVSPERAATLIDALIAAGFSDKGAHSANRVVRVPGSLNMKPGKERWRARLSTWAPDNAWTFSELCGLFHVIPRDTHSLPKAARSIEGKVDPVEDWIWAHEGELGGAIGGEVRGLIPLRCPQEHLHTVTAERGNDTSTSWLIAERSFKCLHEHCVGFRTAEYKAWILETDPEAEIGGPAIDPEALAKARKRLLEAHPGVRFPKMPVAEDERLHGTALEQHVAQSITDDLVKVASEDMYWSLSGKAFKSRAAIDDEWTPRFEGTKLLDRLTPGTKRPGAPMAVSAWLRRNPDVQHADKLVHRLGAPQLCDGDLNIAEPLPRAPDAHGEPEYWLSLVEFLCGGDGAIVDHFLDWLSIVVGNITMKPGWHVVMWGEHGVGKDLVMEPLMRWFGEAHYKLVSPVEVGSQFNGFLTKRLIVLDELEMNTQGAITAHDVYNTLKPWTALGNSTFQINEKYRKPYSANNLSCWYITSNSNKPLPLEPGDRRYLVIETPRKALDKDWYQGLVEWGNAGGWDQVIAWLCRQWNTMQPAIKQGLFTLAPMTKAKARLIEASAEGIMGALRLITGGLNGVVWPQLMTMDDILAALRQNNGGYLTDQQLKQINRQRVAPALRAAGWVMLFDGEAVRTTDGRRKSLWCQGGASKAALYEQLGQGPKLWERYVKERHTPGGQRERDANEE